MLDSNLIFSNRRSEGCEDCLLWLSAFATSGSPSADLSGCLGMPQYIDTSLRVHRLIAGPE